VKGVVDAPDVSGVDVPGLAMVAMPLSVDADAGVATAVTNVPAVTTAASSATAPARTLRRVGREAGWEWLTLEWNMKPCFRRCVGRDGPQAPARASGLWGPDRATHDRNC